MKTLVAPLLFCGTWLSCHGATGSASGSSSSPEGAIADAAAPSSDPSLLTGSLDARAEGGDGSGPAKDGGLEDCPCSTGKGLDPSEVPVSGEVLSVPWDMATLVPWCPEWLKRWPTVSERGSVRRQPLDAAQLSSFWKAYRSVRSSGSAPPSSCGINARVAVFFTTTTGAEHWVGTGGGCPVMQSDDHACHAVDPDIFRQIVDVAGARSKVVKDRVYGKFL